MRIFVAGVQQTRVKPENSIQMIFCDFGVIGAARICRQKTERNTDFTKEKTLTGCYNLIFYRKILCANDKKSKADNSLALDF